MYDIKEINTNVLGDYCPHLPPKVRFKEMDGTDVTYTQPGAVTPESHAQTCAECNKPRFIIEVKYSASWRDQYPNAYKTEAEVLEDMGIVGGGDVLSSRFFESA